MKNIHILPTDKPSRLIHYLKDNSWDLFNSPMPKIDNVICQNIYIINSEEIKEGERGLSINNAVYTHLNHLGKDYGKKIILTTDQDLIKDGIQAIDDEFLEWFVKNPNCESVEVVSNYRVKSGNIEEHKQGVAGYEYYEYKIIIPKEEPKERLKKVLGLKHPKQETLEETIGLKAHEYSMQYVGTDKYTVSMLAIEFGYHLALEQEQEKSYSEEDMHNLMDEYQNWLFNTNTVVLTFREWFKQFKKK